jgi:hypothetical protein
VRATSDCEKHGPVKAVPEGQRMNIPLEAWRGVDSAALDGRSPGHVVGPRPDASAACWHTFSRSPRWIGHSTAGGFLAGARTGEAFDPVEAHLKTESCGSDAKVECRSGVSVGSCLTGFRPLAHGSPPVVLLDLECQPEIGAGPRPRCLPPSGCRVPAFVGGLARAAAS